jgi:DedD protein
MERQKIFWVVLSVSVFVVVVLVVGVFLLRQKPQASFASATPTVTPLADPGTQVYEYQASPGASSSQQGSATDQSGGNTETMHFYIGEGQSKGGAGQSGSTAVPSVKTPGTAAAPQTGSAAASGSPGTAPAAVSVAPALPVSPAVTGTARIVPGLGSSTVAKAAPARPAPRVTEYWIQTGSYKSQTKAEDLASLLGTNGLDGRVFSFASQGSTWYRVRVGPYTSRGEADKFLAEVKKLQGLETSFISQVAPRKTPIN